MYAARRLAKKGFTLVEILIVVIILGILAAIVIPQFTSASDDARKNSLTAQVQTLRGQVELYKLQHTSGPDYTELLSGATADAQWSALLNVTDPSGATWTTGTKCGPYLQTMPVNGLNNFSFVEVATAAVDPATYNPADTAGFVYDPATGKFFATNKDCTALWTGAE